MENDYQIYGGKLHLNEGFHASITEIEIITIWEMT